MKIIISNSIFKNNNYFDTFAIQDKYKFFGIGSTSSTLVSWYKELLQEVLGSKVDENLEDYKLSTTETQAIKAIFENKIDEFIELIENPKDKPKHRRLIWKGKNYDLNLSLTSPNNRSLWDFYTIIQIAEECLNENKPMYITFEQD